MYRWKMQQPLWWEVDTDNIKGLWHEADIYTTNTSEIAECIVRKMIYRNEILLEIQEQ